MDPVGPWSTYASYNRLAGVQPSGGGGGSSADLHHHHHLPAAGVGGGTPTTTTTQLISGGFLSPPPVAYETVFTPLFHHAGAKAPTHYVAAPHRTAKQHDGGGGGSGDYHQSAGGFFETAAAAAGWQQNSPFGILPHESVVGGATKTGGGYENFAHFAVQNHLKNNNRSQSPKQSAAAVAATTAQTFFQITATTSNNLQPQSCIVSSSSSAAAAAAAVVVTKEYRVPQTGRAAAAAAVFLSATNNRNKQQQQQIQTKAQTKIYPEINNQNKRTSTTNDDNQSFAGKQFQQQQQQNYRHYNSVENDYNNTNGPDCNVATPRRPSPLQAHSQQPSPLGHTAAAPTPVYPMYNSPMNSIASPQQQQVTSPLDVTLSRPPTTTNVAYPSVITRALNNNNNNNTTTEQQQRYERPLQQNNQNCWSDRTTTTTAAAAQNRKFNYATTDNRTTTEQTDRQQQQQYFDGHHQVTTLQDLSSCNRGDPMTIVKNLQQQQTCHEVVSKGAVKRRKSHEKVVAATAAVVANDGAAAVGGATVEYFTSRIPPPAHTSTANQPPPQQNGSTYFDFDRWNLPTPPSKIFSTQAVHQQHQGLMVPHPHPHHPPPPPLPYFPPFHLPPHPAEFELTSAAASAAYNGGEQSGAQTPYAQIMPIVGNAAQSQQHQQQQQDDNQPKVVVPNIEEELNFLSEGTVRTPNPSSLITKPPHQAGVVAPITKPTDKPTGPGAGFMSSYLKFLQGERDSSPPPVTRGARKQTWSRTPKPDTKPATELNGSVTPIVTAPPPQPPPPIQRLSQGDPQDDPRYFPLPKERKRSLDDDSSDEGLSSDDDLFNRKVQPVIGKEEKKERGRRGRQSKGNVGERKRTKKEGREKKSNDERKNNSESNMEPLPRRETSKRAAKDKINMKQFVVKQGDDDLEEPPEFADSDSDPAWTPQAKNDAEDESLEKRRKRGRPVGSKKKSGKNFISSLAQEIDIDKKQKSAAKQKQSPPTLEDNIAAAVAVQENVAAPEPDLIDSMPFKPGEFVVIKSELTQDWPSIWRVDGKALLQKYEPFVQNGRTLYRNISTYTSWTPESRKLYVSVPVRCKSQSQMETVVEFLRSEMTIVDQEFYDRVMRDSMVYQDNFEVYIQTLISQALDSNFLTEILQEKDDYFLSNVKTIDDVTDGKRQRLLMLLRWPPSLIVAISTWPCYNMIRELNATDMIERTCSACLQVGVAVRVLMYGQPYNSTTLEGCQPDPYVVTEKDFFMCRMCVNRVELLNKITHQKYLMYIECAKRVTEKRTAESHKDTTCILNELLADEPWLNQLFFEVRSLWAEVDSLEHGYRLKDLRPVQ